MEGKEIAFLLSYNRFNNIQRLNLYLLTEALLCSKIIMQLFMQLNKSCYLMKYSTNTRSYNCRIQAKINISCQQQCITKFLPWNPQASVIISACICAARNLIGRVCVFFMSPMSPCSKSEGNGPLTPNYTVTTVSLCTLLEIHQGNSDLNLLLKKKKKKRFQVKQKINN